MILGAAAGPIAWGVLLTLLVLAGMILILFGLAGQFLAPAGATVYVLCTSEARLGWVAVAVFWAAAALTEAADYLAAGWGARRFGASRGAGLVVLVGGLAGSLVCAPILFPFGAVLGCFAGCFVSAAAYELLRGRKARESVRAGAGALVGRLAGIALKEAALLGVAVFVAAKLFFGQGGGA